MKKFIMFVMTAALVLSSFSGANFAAFAEETQAQSCAETDCDGVYENGFCTKNDSHFQAAKPVSASHHSELNGTHGGYYAIENAGQLYWFAKKVDDKAIGSVSGKNVKANAVLTDDIVDNKNVLDKDGNPNSATFKEYNPIGSNSVYFCGIFDGNGKTVSGLYYKNTNGSHIGLVAYILDNNACVKNVTVKDSYFYGSRYIGGIVGSNGNGKIENCHSYATIVGKTSVGGVAGIMNNSAKAENSTNHGKVYGSNQTGGFVGEISSSYSPILNNCANFGDVEWVSGSQGYVGGFGGTISGGIERGQAELTNCFNAGNVTYKASNAYDNYIGGFVGDLGSKTALKNCYTTGKVKTATYNGSTSYLTGGFAGSADAKNLTNCYFNSENITKGEEKVTSGIGKSGAEYTETQLCAVSTEEIKSGKLAYKLNGDQTSVVFKQTLKTNAYPTFSGEQVYFSNDFEKYYNLDYMIFGINSGKVGVAAPKAGTYTLVFADYDGGVLKNCKTATVVAEKGGEASTSVPSGINMGQGDKIMFWNDLTSFVPLCDSFVVEQ